MIKISNIFGQVFGEEPDSSFLYHLKSEKLYQEAVFYLDKCDLGQTHHKKFFLLKALFYANIGQMEDAYDLIPEMIDTNHQITLRASIYLRGYMYDTVHFKNEMIRFRNYFSEEEYSGFHTTYQMMKGNSIDQKYADQANLYVSAMAKNYKEYQKRSPFLAGLLSTIIPGSGKWYIGYKHQAVSSFMINTVLALIIAESYRQDSGAFVKGASISLFSLFYAGNIYGSFKSAQKQHYDFKNQTRENIKDYYYNKFRSIDK
ncbi:MAG: hypothetical protein ACOC4B_00855 [Bacteroidota bacterium]